jgi:hypothetical protein
LINATGSSIQYLRSTSSNDGARRRLALAPECLMEPSFEQLFAAGADCPLAACLAAHRFFMASDSALRAAARRRMLSRYFVPDFRLSRRPPIRGNHS